MDLAPTAINSPELDKQAKIFSNRACLPKKPFWLLIIGGSGSGYKYRDKDWHQLSTWANDACKNFNIQWLITTSRRTGTTAENILRSKITPENIAYAVWWGEKNEKILPALMGASQRIFVTADSMSMITEAISSSRPVNVLYTQSKNVNTRYEEALDRLYNNGYCSADNFYDSEISPVTAQESAIHTAATSLTERLVHLINNERSEIFSKDQAATRG
jgi:mitochondrial fission protein ELM1